MPENTKRSQIKFAPVKLVVLENRGQYLRTIVFAIGIGLSHVMIGAVIMSVFYYFMATDVMSLHAVLCTVGYQFFTAQGILSFTHANGWSSPLKLRHRKFVHYVFETCGICITTIGTGILLSDRGIVSTVHSLTGFFALAITLLCLMCAPLTMLELNVTTNMHKILGISALLISSVSLCLAFYTTSFRNWAQDTVMYILSALVIFITLCIASNTIMRTALKLNRIRDCKVFYYAEVVGRFILIVGVSLINSTPLLSSYLNISLYFICIK